MALKKTELYSSLWASCDELRGGMDASQYKDYVLALLFVKYISDKFLPDSAIDLIDHTMSVLKTAGESFLKERNHLITKIIHLEDNTNNYTEDERKMHADWSLKDLIEKTKYLISTADAQEEEKELPKFENADEILKFSRELIEKTEKIEVETNALI